MAIKHETLSKGDMDVNQSTLRHSVRVQWLMLTIALAIIAGLIGYESGTAYYDITSQEHNRLQTQSRVIALNIGQQLAATDLALISVIKDMANLRKRENMALINNRLKVLTGAMPGIRTIIVLDAGGTAIASNRDELIGRDFRNRDYFATPAKDKNPSVLYLSPPFKTVLGSFLINVSLVIPASNGGIYGVVTAGLDPEYFKVLLSSVLYAPDMLSTIVHADGIRFMMIPDKDGRPGENLSLPNTFYTRHRESGNQESVLTGKSPGYSSERVIALRTVQPQKLKLNKPLYVACSRDLPAIYEQWRKNTLKQAVVFALVSMVTGSGLTLLQRRQRGLAAGARELMIERKEMEASLHESHQLMVDIFDFLPDATFVVDRNKTVIAWNRAMEEMSGVPKEKMLGQGDHAYTIPFYGDRRKQLIDLLDADDNELKTEYRDITRLGEILCGEAFCPALHNGKGAYVWATVAPLHDCNGKKSGAIESIRDITAIKETEANLVRSNFELEQFAYIASHDLKEPLRKITGFTELLANRCEGTLDEKSESYMAYIIDGATRMSTLIDDLLSYSLVMRSKRELVETDCSAVLSRVVRDLEPAIRESSTEIVCGALPVIKADQIQLGQLFQNLISNAIKYRGAAAPRIAIDAIRQDSEWLFSVTDNGIGIDPEFYERIFVIFQRLHTRAEYTGTGIGLAVCRKIVEHHGGKIWVKSTSGRGSTFFFTMPTIPNDPELIT